MKLSRRLVTIPAALAVLVLGAGCLTTTAHIKVTRSTDGGTVDISQPKDTAFEELTYNYDPITKAVILTIKKYTSNANIQALTLQAETVKSVATGVASGLAGVVSAAK